MLTGFVQLKFFSIYFTITEVKNIIFNTEDFTILSSQGFFINALRLIKYFNYLTTEGFMDILTTPCKKYTSLFYS